MGARTLFHRRAERVRIISPASAFAKTGGTAFPIWRKAGFIVPQKTKPSGKDCNRARFSDRDRASLQAVVVNVAVAVLARGAP